MFKKILLTLTIISLFVSIYIFRHYFNIFYFQNDINTIAINVETDNVGDLYACFNKNCDKMKYLNGVYSYKLNQQKPIFYYDIVDNIEIVSQKPFQYNAISLFVSNNLYYFNKNDIFQKETEFNSQIAYSINIPFQNNNKNLIQKLSVYFESIFYNWYLYIAFYILFFIYLIKYKPDIKINIFLILALAVILRLSHITFISLWNDELYSFCHISNMGEGFNLKNTFIDPGNPPLFFVISNIWLYFFNKSVFLIRLLPAIIGILMIYSIYYVVKEILNEKTALIASFLSSINIVLIVQSNEIRSYIFSMMLIVWGLYYFYKLKKEFSNNNLIFYSLLSIILINTHYYCILYVLFNFILGMILFKNKRIKYFIANLISFISFVPYFIISNKISLSQNFNTWIEKPSIDILQNHVVCYFGNIIFLIIVILFSIFIFKKLKKDQKEIFIYTTSAVIFIFLCALLFSLLIKPVLFERYFCIFLPYLIINTAIFLNLDLKPYAILIIFLFSISIPKYENFNLFSNINFAFRYAVDDAKNYKNYNVVYVFPDNINYAKYFPQIPKDKIIVSYFGIREDIDLIDFFLKEAGNKDKRKTVLYLPEICINSKIKYSKTLNVKRIYTTIVPIYKVVIE